MSLSAKIREQLINSFRVELAEHVQTMNDGLLALEQRRVEGEQRQATLGDIFRAAHSLKGAARALGVTVIEQLAHALESVLDAMQRDAIELNAELFTACYQAIDAIQAAQAAYEAGEITPPIQVLQALSGLEPLVSGLQGDRKSGRGTVEQRRSTADVVPGRVPDRSWRAETARPGDGGDGSPGAEPRTPAASTPARADATRAPATSARDNGEPSDGGGELGRPATQGSVSAANETIRVSVSKLDALMAQLSELLVTRIHAEQRLAQMREFQDLTAVWQKEWLDVRGVYNRLGRHEKDGILSWHRIKSVDAIHGNVPDTGNGHGERPRRSTRSDGPSTDELMKEGKDLEDLRQLGKDVSRLLGYVGASLERLRQMNALVNDLTRQYANDTMQMSLVIDGLEQEVKRVRMLPLNTITASFGRMVRDLAQESGKEAVLDIVGGETELDKRVLEQIKDPLMHLLRNAVDHGIEPPEERAARGKPRRGRVTLTAEQLGKNVVIAVSDDGRGLDLEAIRRAIARRSKVDTHALSEADLTEAIFNTGFSTSPIITDISGRGVGLDVVRRNVETLHGIVDLDWAPGKGVTFTLTLPLTLTSSRALLLRAAGQVFAVPLGAVERIKAVLPREVSSLAGHDAVLHNGRPLMLVRLGDVLELPRVNGSGDETQIPVVILAAAERRMAFAVDELLSEQEVVMKGLGKQLSRVGGVAGGTVMGSGEVVLILNVADLIKLALRGERRSVLDTLATSPSRVEERARRRVLVVDDSITTRTLEKNILEAAGYAVQLAIDGEEALSAITTEGMPDLIVSDIAMPRINGFDLTQRIKEDPVTSHLPVILVTSLDSSEDKAHGIEVGADAYIVKSGFDQNNLLETIEQLI
jgi:two-component system chemotaxis sensor kinase CheA